MERKPELLTPIAFISGQDRFELSSKTQCNLQGLPGLMYNTRLRKEFCSSGAHSSLKSLKQILTIQKPGSSMTSNILRITTILFLFTAFPGQPAWAQGERGRREDPFDREEMIRRFDADGDGELNSAEREKMRDFILNSLQERPEGNRPPQPPQGAPGGRGAGPGRQDLKVVARFDKDGDGKLNDEERAKARVYVKEQGSSNRRRGRRPGGGGEPRERNPGKPEKLTPADVKNYPGKSLYDTSILRTIFIEFPGEDWETELADFYRTDVEMPVDMTVDGKEYKGVGVQFRGNSSFFGVSAGQKRSFNIRMEYGEY